jgi:hypothetical protein
MIIAMIKWGSEGGDDWQCVLYSMGGKWTPAIKNEGQYH